MKHENETGKRRKLFGNQGLSPDFCSGPDPPDYQTDVERASKESCQLPPPTR